MNNYRIRKPSTFIDEIGSQRLQLTNEQLETNDIQTKAQLYQKLCEDHKNHWDILGKAVSTDFSMIKGDPFILEKHNACVKALDMDTNILYKEYPKILDILNTNYNYNTACNEILKYRVNVEDSKISSIIETAPTAKQGHISITIKDNLTDKTKIDKGLTTTDIVDGHAILSLQPNGYNLSQNASAYAVNMRQFEKSSGMEAIMGTVTTLDIAGVESNGFPGSTHEGHKSYGNYTDSDGNTTMTQLIELVNGQDIHNDVGSILDNNANTWYEIELVNVTQEAWNACQSFGFKYSEPNAHITWAQGKKTGEILKLALLIKLKDEIPANQIELKLHNTKPIANITGMFVRGEDGKWITIINNGKNVNNGVPSDVKPEEVNNIQADVDAALANIKETLKTNPTQAFILVQQWNGKGTNKEIGIRVRGTGPEVIVTNVGSRNTFYEYPGAGGMNYPNSTQPAQTNNNYPETTVTTGMNLQEFTDTLTVNQTISADKDVHKIIFENKFIKDILIVLTQTVSYDCDIIHRYYQRLTTTRTTTTEVDAGLCGGSDQTTNTTYDKKTARIDGENAPAELLFSNIGGQASQGGNIGSTIGTILTGIGMLIGGPAAPILAGIGMVAGLFGAGDSSSTSTDVVEDKVITGLELLKGWRYAIGVKDINVYGNNYAVSSELASCVYNLPLSIKSVSISASEMIPRSYPQGVWLQYFISLDKGATWLSINPKNFPLRDTSIPRKYIINPDDKYVRRSLEELITLKADTHCVQFKCVLTRPDEYPYNLYTPSLEGYSIHVEGQ